MSRSYECYGPECASSCATGSLLRRKEIKIINRAHRRRIKEVLKEYERLEVGIGAC